jgi:hypothetical protein
MSYKLYQVAVIENVEVKKDEQEKPPKILLEPITVIAKSEQDAAIRVAMLKGELLKSANAEMVEVIVRPF